MGDYRRLPHHIHEEARRERAAPEVVERERALAVDKALREARAESRRRRFVTADEYETAIASENEPQENRY